MGTGKTDLDCRREMACHGINSRLFGTSVRVSSGGRSGPYHVSVDRLNRKQVDAVIAAVLAALGRQAGPFPESDEPEERTR